MAAFLTFSIYLVFLGAFIAGIYYLAKKLIIFNNELKK
jgi:hypothetical protein